jgi:hypothetical protein
MKMTAVYVLSVSVVSLGVLLHAENKPEKGDTAPTEAEWQKAIQLVDTINKLDDANQEIRSENSHLFVDTPAISSIVKKGPSAIPALLLVMKCPDISFDTFARCYSACDQILSKLEPGIELYWTGGSRTKTTHDKRTRIVPGDYLDEQKFRVAVVKDIEEKYNAIMKKKDK